MKFTYYTIIGRNSLLLDGHLSNINEHAGFARMDCDKEIIVVVYRNKSIPKKITNSILSICEKHNARPVIHDEVHDSFIHNLYACWNLGYQEAGDGFVFRAGSDQVFSKDAMIIMCSLGLETEGTKTILQAQTIENKNYLAPNGIKSRHFMEHFGDNFSNLDLDKFEEFCSEINYNVPDKLLDIFQCMKHWSKPTVLKTSLGNVHRTDGCSWLMTRKEWEEFGPLPVIENGITGDVIIHDRLQQAGYKNLLTRDCVTYHFVRGESGGQYT